MLVVQLEIADQLKAAGQPFGIEPVLQAIEQKRPERIIAAARIAAGENDAVR